MASTSHHVTPIINNDIARVSDITIVCQGEDGNTLHLKVHSGNMMNGSPVFHSMLQSDRWLEGQQATLGSGRRLVLKEQYTTGLELLCKIFHSSITVRDVRPTIQHIMQLVHVANKYICLPAVMIWVEHWTKKYATTAPTPEHLGLFGALHVGNSANVDRFGRRLLLELDGPTVAQGIDLLYKYGWEDSAYLFDTARQSCMKSMLYAFRSMRRCELRKRPRRGVLDPSTVVTNHTLVGFLDHELDLRSLTIDTIYDSAVGVCISRLKTFVVPVYRQRYDVGGWYGKLQITCGQLATLLENDVQALQFEHGLTVGHERRARQWYLIDL